MHIPTARVSGLSDPLPDDLVVLDVREQDEWDAGHVAGSTHLPLSQLAHRATEVPRGREVLVVCRSGARSARVTAFLVQQGLDAVNLEGGLQAWAAAGRPLVAESGGPPTVR